MKLSELPPETIAKIKQYRWDRIIEKHEGPERWLAIDGRRIATIQVAELLP